MKGRPRLSYSAGGPVASRIVDEAVVAEKLGYDVVWVADHLADIPPITAVFDAWTVLAFIGARTKRIGLGSGVTDIQRVHPAKVASSVATLDNLTDARAILGIGAGEVMNVRPYGMKWEGPELRVARFREYLQVVQLLWSSSYNKPSSWSGTFYRINEGHLGLQPVRRPRPPIYVGAFASEKMLRVAGAVADGWFPGAFYDPHHFREKVEVIRRAAETAGRSFDKFDVMASIPVIYKPDSRTLEKLKEKFKRSLVINRYMLRLLGEDEAYMAVSKKLQYQLITPTPHYERVLQKVVRDLPISAASLQRGIEDMMAVGSADRCLDTFERFLKAGATHLHISPFMAGSESYKHAARMINSHFR